MPKINHKTLCNTFEDRGGLKNVDFKKKKRKISLQCSWVKKLHGGNHHGLKIIPGYFINNYFGKFSFKVLVQFGFG